MPHKAKFQVGDVVRRKGDTSGRTRRVKEIYTGGAVVLLDEFLDGWLPWASDKLELVRRASETVPQALRIPVKKQ